MRESVASKSKQRMEQIMESVIALSSVTYAMKGAALLRRHGIAAQTVRLEPKQTKRGCAYGLQLAALHQDRAAKLLKDAGIPFSEVLFR